MKGGGEFNQPPEEQFADPHGPSAGRGGDGYYRPRQNYGHHAEGGNRFQAPSLQHYGCTTAQGGSGGGAHFQSPYQHHGPVAFHGGTRFHPSNQGAPFDHSYQNHNYGTPIAHGGSVGVPFNTSPYHHYMNEGAPSFDQAYHSHGHHAQGGSGGIGLHPSLQHHGPAAAHRGSGHTQSDPSFQTNAHHDGSLNEAIEVAEESLQ
eukprot:scaffold378556_cov35-Attheya_sp.AAC.1